MLFAVIILLVICVGPQAPARLLYKYYGQYNSIAIIYTCITQQVKSVFICSTEGIYRVKKENNISRQFLNFNLNFACQNSISVSISQCVIEFLLILSFKSEVSFDYFAIRSKTISKNL